MNKLNLRLGKYHVTAQGLGGIFLAVALLVGIAVTYVVVDKASAMTTQMDKLWDHRRMEEEKLNALLYNMHNIKTEMRLQTWIMSMLLPPNVRPHIDKPELPDADGR